MRGGGGGPTLSLVIFFFVHIPHQPASAQLLEIFGLSNGRTGTVDRQPFHDLASQTVGLISYMQKIQKNPDNELAKKLSQPLPQMTLVDGIPVVPGIVGSLPGAGGCLPRGSPLVKSRSPSLLQNFIRNIPGVSDYLSSFLPAPEIRMESLFGKYEWVRDRSDVILVQIIDTPSVHDRYCPSTESADLGNSSGFSLVDKFRIGSARGGEKVAFGYGLKHRKNIFLYFQDDPCPYQIILTGPRNKETGQYEYLLLSNWARYPIIGLARSAAFFHSHFEERLERELVQEGFISSRNGMHGGTISYVEWSYCRPATPVDYVSNVLRDLFG